MAGVKEYSGADLNTISRLSGVSNVLDKINGVSVSAATLLLDTYTGAAAAYSVRKLRTAYAGSAIRVREDSGDTELDIGFDSNGDLDTAAIATHCGVNNGYVVTWYDQSGNGNHLSQATAASQPQIYNGSAVVTENGQPCIEFVSSDILNTGTFNGDPQFTQPTTWFWTINKASHSSYLFDDYGTIGRQAQGDATWVFAGSTANNFFPSADLNQQRLFTLLFDGASSISRMNASATGSGNPGTNGSRGISINSSDLKLQEIVVYNADQTSNFTGIETNINSDFLIYQPTDTPTSGLLATYSGAAAAYSVRQLANTAVIAMTVRRDSDDEEKRFGFDENGDLATADIAAFCGSANGYVSQWWDQSTNGNHASQGTAASQPQIYDGAMINLNGKPLVKATRGGGLAAGFDVSISLVQAFTVVSVGEVGNLNAHLYSDSTRAYWMRPRDAGLAVNSGTTLTAPGTITHSGQIFAAYIADGSSSYVEATSSAGSVNDTGNSGSVDFSTTQLLNRSTYDRAYAAQEVIFWNTDQGTTNIAAIELDMDTYYSFS